MSDIFVLGINVSHDVSCAILKNGELMCAIAEERLNRIKRFNGGYDMNGMMHKHLPQKAIQYCLNTAKVSLKDIDLIVVSTCVVVNYRSYQVRSLKKSEILEQLPDYVDAKKVKLVNHHLGHAASVFYPSGFLDAAIIVVDGGGSLVERENDDRNNKTEYFEERVTIYHGIENKINVVKQYLDGSPSDGYLSNKEHGSLGDFYQSATVFVGFSGGDEGKTMGLAPYGSDRYFEKFMGAINFNGEYLRIKSDYQFNKWKEEKGRLFYNGQFGRPREKGEAIRQVDKDISAAVQYALEETMIKIANEAFKITKSKQICLSGGVALNSVANKKVLDRSPFENIFIQPASGDDGCALGNALLGWSTFLEKPRKWHMKTGSMGKIYSKNEINRTIEKFKCWFHSVKTLDEVRVVKEASRLISEKNIIGWFQGGAENGPRALGNRSILCDTRYPEMKDILNKRVKYREGFRPFAPSIMKEFNSEYFDLDCSSPFMLLVANVKKADVVPAITHVDQTARVQTVTKEDNGIYYDLIKEYYKLTRIPVILNTSFNVAGEPIVETPEDAIKCFLSTRIDYLVLGDIILKKRKFKSLAFKIWPQDIKRFLIKRLAVLTNQYSFLKKIKIYVDTFLKKKDSVKIPG